MWGTVMIYTDTQIDAMLARAEEVGLISSPGVIKALASVEQKKHHAALQAAMRQVLELLPPPENARTVYGVLCQPWWEKERGWGERPDGWTMHATPEDRKAFIDAYWERMPDVVPDEYSYPAGDAYMIEVDCATYEKVRDDERKGGWGEGNKAPEKANRRDLQVGVNHL
jgi:hypothetical protein